MKRLYRRCDTWAKGLSQGAYAAVLGIAGGLGVLAVGLLFDVEFLFAQAITMALVLFGLEYVFGLHQTTEE